MFTKSAIFTNFLGSQWAPTPDTVMILDQAMHGLSLKLLLSMARIKANRISNASVIRQNFFTANLSDADIVYCYLPTLTLKKLEPKLKKDTTVITYCIKFPSLKLIKELKHHKVYIYRIY